jgi:transcription elongation factor Elf1
MKHFVFDPFGNGSLTVTFNCDNCGTAIVSDEIVIPTPDYTADSAVKSQTQEEGFAVCDHCHKQFDIDVFSTYAGGDGSISDLSEDYVIKVDEYPEPFYEEQYEAISSNTYFLQTFRNAIENLKELNSIQIEKTTVDRILRQQIFVGVIAAMETYLSDAFINTTLKSEEYTKNFVSTFHDFKGRTIPLNELYDYHEKIKTICKQAMIDVIYHNLPKIKGMYKDTLGIVIGDIAIAQKAVNIRHHLVHRNGKDKKGDEVIITKISVEKLIVDISSFIESIDEKIEALNEGLPW